ncbi:hypothetical protein GGX14DRAFT_373433 [Mycena pura]|uniref:Uncharacterized protein n=1 Tax=Mycena pura TaxID=153505 RepID=A0AAD6V3S4_9AGAR|nr:hypothetical protein GGX14DRAFT_373433 [Mycena pura]
MDPSLDTSKKENTLPRYSVDVGNGYALLRRRDRYNLNVTISEPYASGILEHLCLQPRILKLKRWARLRLPNGQIARSHFSEDNTAKRKLRCSRVVKVHISGDANQVAIYDIDYYFEGPERQAYAMGSLFLPPDKDLLRQSHGAVWSSPGIGETHVFHVYQIVSVVAMVPWDKGYKLEEADSDFMELGPDSDSELQSRDRDYFLVEKPGLSMAVMSGFEEEDTRDYKNEFQDVDDNE